MTKYRVTNTKRFDRDMERITRQGKKTDKLRQLVKLIAAGEQLPVSARMHKLSGIWNDCFECHVAFDWLLIWQIEGDKLVLTAT